MVEEGWGGGVVSLRNQRVNHSPWQIVKAVKATLMQHRK